MPTSEAAITAFVRLLTLGEDRRFDRHKTQPSGAWQDARPRVHDAIPSGYRLITNRAARELYSYGTHFPLARFVPSKRGRSALWLINGDRWSGGWTVTPRHQSETRAAIEDVIRDAEKIGKNVSSLIVPFSALDGAGIDRDSIRPIHVREDRREVFVHTATVRRDIVERPLPSRAVTEKKYRERDPRGRAIMATETLAPSLTLHARSVSCDTGVTSNYVKVAKLTRHVTFCGYDHSVPNPLGGMSGAYVDYDPPNVKLWLDGSHDVTVEDADADTVRLTWKTSRHWLGDSLFTAKRHGKRSRFVSSFDYNERMPLYFLAALPHMSRATTVEDAIEDLAPSAVHAARARGVDVKRQGDIFAIATPLTDADVYARAKRRTRLTVYTRGAKPRPGELGYVAPLSAASDAKFRKFRRERYAELRANQLAATARPKTPRGWRRDKRIALAEIREEIARHERRIAAGDNVCSFGCGQYRGRSSSHTGETCESCGRPRYYDGYTVANAESGLVRARERYDAKLREPRKRDSGYAYARGRRPIGQCYSRALSAWRDACRAAEDKYTPRIDTEAIRETLAIYGTAHTATEVVVCANGVTYVRGIMRHVPTIAGERFRNADHSSLALDGARWYLAVRNTVPRQ